MIVIIPFCKQNHLGAKGMSVEEKTLELGIKGA